MQTSKPVQAIRLYDPAIDRSKIDAEIIQRYARERDPALLAFLPGKAPVRFHLRRISRRLWDWVEQAFNEADKQTRAFRAAVIRVENMPAENGSRLDWHPAILKDQGGFDVAMTEIELERFAYADIYEIGDVAWTSSFFPLDCVAQWRLLPSSAQVWDQMRCYPSADTSPSDAVQSSGEHRAPQEPSAAPSGDVPTAATVPAIVSSVESTSPPVEAPAAP